MKITNKCTILKYKVFKIKTPGLRHFSTLSCGSSPRSVYKYLYKTWLLYL